MKYFIALCAFLVTIAVGEVNAKTIHHFTESQKEHMVFACDYGKRTDLYDEYDNICYIFSALIWQESGAGLKTTGGKGHIAYGVFQNYLPTVRNRFKQKGINISDTEIKILLNDRNYSAIFAEIEIKDWLKHRKGDLYKSLASYYGGWKWERAKWYADAVMSKAKYLEDNAPFLNPRWEKSLHQDNEHSEDKLKMLKMVQSLKVINILEER